MKNEKLTKNELKEKMMKSCKAMDKVMGGIIWGLVIVFVLAIIIVILTVATNNSQVLIKFQEEVNQAMANINAILQKVVEFYENNGFISFVKFICRMSIFLAIGQILKNTIKNETPFIEKNIKNIKEIAIHQIILFILGDVTLLAVFTIWVLYYMFKYAYILQVESDETL